MEKIQLCLYCIALALISTGVGEGSQKTFKFEIKALKPYHTAQECDLLDLEAAYVSCNRQPIDNYVQNQTYCHVPGNGTILEYHCVEGDWKLSTGTDYHLRERRFIEWIIVGLVTLFTLIPLIYCGTSNECHEQAEDEPHKEPRFTTCKDPEMQSEYTAVSKQTMVKVIWQTPKASGDGTIVSLEKSCCGSYGSGDYFPGKPGSGKTYTMIYKATDDKGYSGTCNFEFIVKYRTCGPPSISISSNIKTFSCPNGYIYGGECMFECLTGYEFIGRKTSECQYNEKWDNLPNCQKKKCGKPPFSITHGTITCDGHSYENFCEFQCYPGFTLKGPRRMQCRADRTWSVSGSGVSCVDSEPPKINCKERQIFHLDFGRNETLIIWEEPTATDNVDKLPSIKQQRPLLSQNQSLSEGLHYVKYKATDKTGNSDSRSSCTITLDVRVIMCSGGPTDALANSRFMMKNCSYPQANYPKSFYSGVSCQLWCDLNLPLNGSDVLTCERDGEKNTAVWKSGSENIPFCEVVQCPALDPPANGAFTTDSINARPLHVMFCKQGYDIPAIGSAFQGRLSCQDSGKWYPLDDFPDCIVPAVSWLILPAELRYEGNCNDNKTKEKIKQKVLKYLAGVQEDVDKSICPDANTCKVENVNVFCGETAERKRRSGVKNIFIRQAGYALVRWNMKIIFDKGNETVRDKYVELSSVLNSMKNKIQEDVSNGKLDIQGFTISSDAFHTDQQPGLKCDSGHAVDYGSTKCKPCPRGTYLNSITTHCELCNVGEYMDHDGASVCKKCPEGYSTLSTGSKDLSKCTQLCSPGYFSSSSMEPCSSCPMGTYQPLQGQEKCFTCPFGTTTKTTTITSKNECDFFDILVEQISKKTAIGTFGANKTSTLSLAVWLKLQNEVRPELSFDMADSESNDLVSFNVSDFVYVGFGTSSMVSTNTSLSSEHWTHLIYTVDVAKRAQELYIDGELAVNETEQFPDPSRTISSGTVQIRSNKGGIYMSSLVVYNRVVSSNEKAALSQSCVVAQSDEIFSMPNILTDIVQGISVVTPTTCDPVDECSSRPCGNHKCVNLEGGFECLCHGEMTGKLCNEPPDYCRSHGCIHGNCIPGNGTYTCNCTDRYTGGFCDIPPVNEEWSYWGEWSGCDVTCGGGARSRTRRCENSPLSFLGKGCEGNDKEVESCNDEQCPTCRELNRRSGTILTCIHNDRDNLEECNMTCMPGTTLTNGQEAFTKYWCGPSTYYEWIPIDKIPECVKVTRPDEFGTLTSMSYETVIPDSDMPALAASIKTKVTSGIGCVKSGLCKMSTSVSNKSRKRSTESTVTLQFFIKLNEEGDLDIADYLRNGTETPALSELIEALCAISDTVEYIQNNTVDIFQATVNGVDYVPESNSSNMALTVTCPSGQAGAGGLCGACPAGTKLVEVACLSCEVGTYQPSKGQTKCLQCPEGYSTLSHGSIDESECLKLCSPGFFSSSSMEPCSACPVGTYQSLDGQTNCSTCPLGTATNVTSSKSIEECKHFDISVGQIYLRTIVGMFHANRTSSLSLSVWLKLKSKRSSKVSIYVTDSEFNEVITLSLSDFVAFGTLSSVASSKTSLSSERWTHVICTVDVAKQTVDLYIDGELVVNEIGQFQDSSHVISSGTVQLRSTEEGIYISGLVVYDRIVSIDDKAALSQSCTVAPSDQIFSMTDILSIIGEGISVIVPTTCAVVYDTLSTTDTLTTKDTLTSTDKLTTTDKRTTINARTTTQSDDNNEEDVEESELNRTVLIMVIVVSTGTIALLVVLGQKILRGNRIIRLHTLGTTGPDETAPSLIDANENARVIFNPGYEKDLIPSINLLNPPMEPTFQVETPVYSSHAVDQLTESAKVS